MGKEIIRITENDIHSIIKECVIQILNEGYSGKYWEDQVEKIGQAVTKWKERCDKGEGVLFDGKSYRTRTELKINLKPFQNSLKGNIQQKYLKNIKVYLTLFYSPDENSDTNGSSEESGGKLHIKLNIGKRYTEEYFKECLLHELTHVTDKTIKNYQNSWSSGTHKYRSYHHQYNSESPLPTYIQLPMYYLWDTSEFNAWQANYQDLSTFVEQIMTFLEDANKDNNQETWEMVKQYLIEANSYYGLGMAMKDNSKKDFGNTPWQAVKHYFIKTSFNKLKKFIQKVK